MAGKQNTEREEHPLISGILIAVGLAVAIGSLRYGLGAFDSPGAVFLPFFAGAAIALFPVLRKQWKPLGDLWRGVRWQQAAMVTVCLLLSKDF